MLSAGRRVRTMEAEGGRAKEYRGGRGREREDEEDYYQCSSLRSHMSREGRGDTEVQMKSMLPYLQYGHPSLGRRCPRCGATGLRLIHRHCTSTGRRLSRPQGQAGPRHSSSARTRLASASWAIKVPPHRSGCVGQAGHAMQPPPIDPQEDTDDGMKG